MGNCWGRPAKCAHASSNQFPEIAIPTGKEKQATTLSSQQTPSESLTNALIAPKGDTPTSKIRSFSFNDLKNAAKNFRSDSLLGEGGFGFVFKGWIDENTFAPSKPGTGVVVAIKMLKAESFQGHREWLTEVNYLGQLRHENLVRLIGYCSESENRLLVYEFMSKGSLENHLFRSEFILLLFLLTFSSLRNSFTNISIHLILMSNTWMSVGLDLLVAPEMCFVFLLLCCFTGTTLDGKLSALVIQSHVHAFVFLVILICIVISFIAEGVEPIPWTTRMRVAVDVARGLSFLHNLDANVIYRDLKASNVLLDSDFNAKLSDFGLARAGPTGDNTHVSTRVVGTRGYAAPEYVATGHLTPKSDVYSYGVVLLELLSGRRATGDDRPGSVDETLVDWAKPFLRDDRRILRIMDTRLGGQYSKKGALSAASLALRCLHIDPKNRPTMTDVLSAMEQQLHTSKDVPRTTPTTNLEHRGIQRLSNIVVQCVTEPLFGNIFDGASPSVALNRVELVQTVWLKVSLLVFWETKNSYGKNSKV
ncbi:hypothetical protein RHSIM_Rhsim13G0201200 [Rhododendron simsii]|uniref:non-specific serine/threonine protein kinase n=1 Tax=Rhododendron simsii TaxID=118357 RepID=A0A834L6R5_RHOSS|nr:hypothetical protein RHSIM_Rhsim13G0201200 [Rhododendron simsii]